MLFTSLDYLLFLPVVVALFWVLPLKFRLPMLLAASWFFYMCWNPAFILLIAGMTAFNYYWGKLLCKAEQHKKLIFGIGIVANLLCLGVFKYANLFVKSAAGFVGLVSGSNPGWSVDIILPLAISFFTFEFIHYLFEIYRGHKPVNSFVLFSLFAAFFPTQIAGPIKRYPDFVAQMLSHREKHPTLKMFDEGLPLILIGLGKKILLADNLAVLVQMGMKEPSSYGAPELWIFAYAFAFQIYFDFSGYTDIARGSAMLFGYKIPINFNMPYIASNISDFWHRWHISLSSWLRDYLFIPLGGSRGGRWLTHRNLFLTMALGGLWHGASWNFLVWGIFHGLALIVHREFSMWRKSINLAPAKQFFESKLFGALSAILTFHSVCIGWVFFRVDNIGTAFSIVKRMVLLKPIYSSAEQGQFFVLKQNLPVVVPVVLIMVAILLMQNWPVSYLNTKQYFRNLPAPWKAVFCTVLLFAIITFIPDDSKPFIYFQF
ncbi:MAG: hypothetical protein K2X93_15450 [Candidatus Obscuribacterales bacterium]|nr:hypothetical protein [Candidatus Obscuribacterales bacterium]